MTRQLTAKSNPDTLKKEARRWLKALRSGDPRARARLAAAWPQAPAAPGLREIQHALALEHGLPGWSALKEALADFALARRSHRERVDQMLRHVWGGDVRVAERILRRHPEVAHDSLITAVVCGDLAEVERRLAAEPAAATAKGGPLGWEPLLYLAYARLPLPAAADNALAIARRLLDHGADPNAWFNDGWDNPFKVVTGVIGLGEGVRPPHPRARELVELLIERGAEPYDSQALYNTAIVDDDTSWLELLWARSEARGETFKWIEPGHRLGGRIDRGAIDFLLGLAVTGNHLRRAGWLLDHGADPDGLNAYTMRPHHEDAQLLGLVEMADLLVRRGAKPAPLAAHGEFQAAVLRLDRDAARALAERHPHHLRHAGPLLIAAEQGRIQAVRLLLELSVPAGLAAHDGVTALHNSAQHSRVEIARLLLDQGADIDPVEGRFGATPLGWAVHLHQPAMIELLAPLSRDVWSLTAAARFDRLRELLAAAPALANARGTKAEVPPLFRLPDDEDLAEEAAALLLEHGAYPSLTNAEGLTAEQEARRRGLEAAADLMKGRSVSGGA